MRRFLDDKVGRIAWQRTVLAAAIVSGFAFLLVYVFTLISVAILSGPGVTIAAAEVMTGPASDLSFAVLVFWQAAMVARTAGDQPFGHGLLVGVLAATFLQLLYRFLAPPVWPAEALTDFVIAASSGAAAGYVTHRTLLGRRALLRTLRAFKGARDPEALARAVVENMGPPQPSGACLIAESPRCACDRVREDSLPLLACWSPDANIEGTVQDGFLAIDGRPSWSRVAPGTLPEPLRGWLLRTHASSAVIVAPPPVAKSDQEDTPETRGLPSPASVPTALVVALPRRAHLPAAARTDYLTLAEEAVTALHNLRLIASERRNAASVSESLERKRIARELHDNTKGALAGLALLVSACQKSLARQDDGSADDALHDNLVLLRRVIDETIVDHERIIASMRRSALDSASLHSAMRRRAERLARATDADVHFAVHGKRRPLDEEAEDHIYAVFDESLTNVAKHAHAANVSATLTYEEDAATVAVSDDGVGFDNSSPAVEDAGGVGSQSMRERAARVGGTVAVDSALGKGTTVILRIPLPTSRGP